MYFGGKRGRSVEIMYILCMVYVDTMYTIKWGSMGLGNTRHFSPVSVLQIAVSESRWGRLYIKKKYQKNIFRLEFPALNPDHPDHKSRMHNQE